MAAEELGVVLEHERLVVLAGGDHLLEAGGLAGPLAQAVAGSPRRVKTFQFTGHRSSSAMNLRSEPSSGNESAVPYSLTNSSSSLRLIPQ